MNRPVARSLFLAALAALTWTPLGQDEPRPVFTPAVGPQPWFEENAGQIAREDVQFVARSPSLEVGFGRGQILFNARKWREGPEESPVSDGGVVFALAVGDGHASPEAVEPLPGRTHYLVGRDPAGWNADVRHFGRILYRDAYPGIDLVYFFDPEGKLTYEFLVRPGADPSSIALRYRWVDGIEETQGEFMEIVTEAGRLRDGPLVCFQEIDGERRTVRSRFVKEGSLACRVELLDPYDPARTLVIDPTIVFSTYHGTMGANSRTVAVDPAGYIYMSGGGDAGWPTTNGAYQTAHAGGAWPDVTVTKFSPAGAVVWSTYIGGPNEDYAYVSEVNSNGEVYVAGRAGDGFPTTPGAFDTTFNGGTLIPGVHSATDGFVVKLASDGSRLLYSTYIGTNGNDTARAIHLFSTGEVAIGGSVEGNNLPTTPGVYQPALRGSVDGYVAKFSADGSRLVFCTYFGANGDTMDFLFSMATDLSGNIWVAGSTNGSGGLVSTANAFQPVHGGGSTESYVGKLSPDGRTLVYFSWLGGSGHEFIETEGLSDAQGNFYVAGGTSSPNFPFSPGAFQSTIKGGRDGFVLKVNANGTVGACTAYGGTSPDPDEQFWGPAIDSLGNIYASGRFPSTDCPITPGAFQPAHAGGKDAVLAVFSPDATRLLYATYLGGSGGDTGRFIRAYPDNTAVVIALETDSTNFPLVNPSQTSPGAALVKFDITDIVSPGAAAMTVSPSGGLTSTGPVGGPFSPSSQPYTVTNSGGASMNWTASANQSWVGLSSSGGTLAAGASASVTVSINPGAGSLGVGSYPATVTFTNTTNGTGNTTRSVGLTVTSTTPGPTVTVTTLPNPTATIDFAGREYLTMRQSVRGNTSASPVVIGTPTYSPSAGGTETTVWTFTDGSPTVDTGFVWMSTQTGNVWTLPLTGDGTPRTVKAYLGIFHNSGSMDYTVGAGTTTATIAKATAGRTLYEVSVTFTGSTTLTVGPVGNLTFAGFELAAALVESSTSPPVDADGDGLPDAWEQTHFGGTSANPGDDPDGDGASNLVEHNAGTDPNVADTDGDGFTDGAEIAAGSNPLDPASVPAATGGGGGGGSGGGGCGATGLEALLALAFARRRRRVAG